MKSSALDLVQIIKFKKSTKNLLLKVMKNKLEVPASPLIAI